MYTKFKPNLCLEYFNKFVILRLEFFVKLLSLMVGEQIYGKYIVWFLRNILFNFLIILNHLHPKLFMPYSSTSILETYNYKIRH